MIAIDTNLLVYAHREELPFHAEAEALLLDLANGTRRWCIPWPCVHEFIGVITNPRIFREPTPLDQALLAVQTLLSCETLLLLPEGDGYFKVLDAIAKSGRVRGALIHDARIAALCQFHGVRELWSADRDFSRFAGIKIVNPLIAA